MSQLQTFPHQDYTGALPTSLPRLVQPGSYPPVGSEPFLAQMRDLGRQLRARGVQAIVLVHGTFVGDDAFGWLTELARWSTAAAAPLRAIAKQWADAIQGEQGNYTPNYVQALTTALNTPGETPLVVRPFVWSSANHHLARADAAVRLLIELADLPLTEPARVLLLGHSHAGNVFALLSHLVAPDPREVEAFFLAARAHYRSPWTGRIDQPEWRRAQELTARPRPLGDRVLDFVTFGTPPRYGWRLAGCGGLLHLIHHRPEEGLAPHVARFPPSADDLLHARGGDYVQQLGIAGTNTMPSLLQFRAWWADHQLNALLQPAHRASDLLLRLRAGRRAPDAGQTLLVDYALAADESVFQHQLGHAVYTRPEWTLFHIETIVRELYEPSIAEPPAAADGA